MNNDIKSIICQYSLSPFMFHTRDELIKVCFWIPREIAKIAFNHPIIWLTFINGKHWELRRNIRTSRVTVSRQLERQIRMLWGYFGHMDFYGCGTRRYEMKYCPIHVLLRYAISFTQYVYKYVDIDVIRKIHKNMMMINPAFIHQTVRHALSSNRIDVINLILGLTTGVTGRPSKEVMVKWAIMDGNMVVLKHIYPDGPITLDMQPDTCSNLKYAIRNIEFVKYLTTRVTKFNKTFIEAAITYSIPAFTLIEKHNGNIQMDHDTICGMCKIAGLRAIEYAFIRWTHLFDDCCESNAASNKNKYIYPYLCKRRCMPNMGGYIFVSDILNKAIAEEDRDKILQIHKDRYKVKLSLIKFNKSMKYLPLVHTLFNFSEFPMIIIRRDDAECFRDYTKQRKSIIPKYIGAIIDGIMKYDAIDCLQFLIEECSEMMIDKELVKLAIINESYLCLRFLISRGFPVDLRECLAYVRDDDILCLLGIRAHVFDML